MIRKLEFGVLLTIIPLLVASIHLHSSFTHYLLLTCFLIMIAFLVNISGNTKDNSKNEQYFQKMDSIFTDLQFSVQKQGEMYKTLLLLVNETSGLCMWIKDELDRFVFIDDTTKNLLFADFEYDDIIGKTDQELFVKQPVDFKYLEDLFKQTKVKDYPDLDPKHFKGKLVCNVTDVITRVLRIPCRFYEEVNGLSLDVRKTPIFDDNSNIMGTVGCLVNVTDQKILWERALKKASKKEEVYKIDGTPQYYIKKYSWDATVLMELKERREHLIRRHDRRKERRNQE